MEENKKPVTKEDLRKKLLTLLFEQRTSRITGSTEENKERIASELKEVKKGMARLMAKEIEDSQGGMKK